MNWILSIVLAVGLAGGAAAGEDEAGALSEAQLVVIDCLEGVGQDTEWGQCMNLLFAECAAHAVGGEDHVGCLYKEREDWRLAMQHQQVRVLNVLTSGGGAELAELMSQWFGYVGQKCQTVAAEHEGNMALSSEVGCEIVEIASVTAEFVACRSGASTAPYCELQK